MRDAPTLSGFAIRASQELGMSHRRTSDEVVGDFVIALRDLKQALPHLVAMMRRQPARAVGLFAIMDRYMHLIHRRPRTIPPHEIGITSEDGC